MIRAGDQIGPYTLISKLGRGAFGTVWLTERRTTITTTNAALKIPLDEDIDLDSVRHEANLWARASGHPNVLPIIEANIYNGQVVIASEYAPEGSLESWLKQNHGRAPSVESVIEILTGVLAGLEHLHGRDIIHRDLKPANILFQGSTPRLSDFGISRVLKSTHQSSVVAGTPAYMAPETFSGKRSEQTDLWAAGVVLYQLLTGALPFPQEDPPSLMYAILAEQPKPLTALVPTPLQAIIGKALQKDPSQRYQSAAEMRRDVRKAGQSLLNPASSGPLTQPPRANIPTEKPAANAETLRIVPPLPTLPGEARIPVSPSLTGRKASAIFVSVGVLATIGFVLVIAVITGYVLWTRPSTVANTGAGKPAPGSTSVRTAPVVTTGRWTLERVLNNQSGGPGSLAFSPDGKTLAVVWNYVGSPTVKLIDVQTGEVKHGLGTKASWVSSINFSPDGKYVVGTADKAIQVWDAATGEAFKTLPADDEVKSVCFSPDGSMLASSGDDKKIIFWDTTTWQRKKSIAEGIFANDIAFSPDSKLIASGPAIRIWDVATGELKSTLKARENDLPSMLVFSPDGSRLATGNLYSQTADIWEVESGRLLMTFKDFTNYVDSVDFSPEGKLFATRSRDGTFKLYDSYSGQLFQALGDVHANPSSGSDYIRFSPDGRWLGGGDGVGHFNIWKRTPGT